MNLYDMLMNPLENRILKRIRIPLMAKAYGDVLEAGAGTGVNLAYYSMDRIHRLICTDLQISSQLKRKAAGKVQWVECSLDDLPFEDQSFDTVVATLVLCTVESVDKSLMEIRRVLRPGGRYLFIEHILLHDPSLSKAFQGMNGIWRRLAHGCNLNRRTHQAIHRHFEDVVLHKNKNGIFCYGIAVKKEAD